jgi:hypothetical protein
MMKYQNAMNKMTQFVTVKSLIWHWGQRSPTMVRDTPSGGGLPTCHIWKAYLEPQKSYSPDTIYYGRRDRFDLEVKGHQQWYATHRLEVVYLHAKYEKPVLNDKKVTARTRFVMDARTSLTLRSKVTNNVTRHIAWRWSTYMPNMQSLSWTTKKLQPGHDLLQTHAGMDRLITIGHPPQSGGGLMNI